MKTRKVNLLLTALLLAGCAQEATAAIPTSTQNVTLETPGEQLPTETALAIQLSKDAAAATAMATCATGSGKIEQVKIDSQYLDAGMRFRIYTPPCYLQETERRYPVLYLVHGQTFTDDQWDRLEADETATQLIAAGELSPFLIVMPYDISSSQPSLDHFGESVVEELLPWVDANYRTIPDKEHRAIGGLSRGASWSIHLGLTHPELFAAVGGHSPPVFVEDASKVRGWLDDIQPHLMPRFWLDIGDRDQERILNSAIWFEGLLDERDVLHEWYLFEGDHSEAYWKAHVEMYLRWYAQDW